MWLITRDVLEGRDVYIGSWDFKENEGAKLTKEFRLLDDDGIVYYRGLSDDSETEQGFAPLDDYGTPNAGCTAIEYWRKDKWVML